MAKLKTIIDASMKGAILYAQGCVEKIEGNTRIKYSNSVYNIPIWNPTTTKHADWQYNAVAYLKKKSRTQTN